MSIQLVTYANQTVTPTNDAIIYEKAIDQNGIFYGCNVTVTSNTVNITGGYGMICGREFTIQSESIAVTLAPSGTLQGRLYVRLDLADADVPIQLLTATGSTLPPLEQDDDVNFTNGTYEMELATFTVGVSSLSDVVETFETIVGTREPLGYEYADGVINSALSRGFCHCYKDKSANTVRAHFYFNSNSNVGTSTTLFTIPSGFRPSSEVNGTMFYMDANNVGGAYTFKVSTAGILTQNAGSTIRQGFGYIEYPIA